MGGLLWSAAGLAVAVGIAHSWLGEKYLVSRLLRRSDLPRLFGSDVFTRRTIRFAWHLTTIAWWGLAAVLVLLGTRAQDPDRSVVLVVAITFGVSGGVALAGSRGRHLSWIAFFAIAALCCMAAAVRP